MTTSRKTRSHPRKGTHDKARIVNIIGGQEEPMEGCAFCFNLQWQYMNLKVQHATGQQPPQIPDLTTLGTRAARIRCGEHAPEPPAKSDLVVANIRALPTNGRIS